ncbi:LANO_0C01904g1_1 [Lachancea nothofagi CBS 11611]|uniref:LANO_0C01904g1_1 n=1 Tax=Lachancea nothofagi CBS 11611 TaxID=1266666 RepID=A0A1G4J4R1_9SACH|nr:LANO_0C01904g1_1 [Lachancea nothofagi CBS 11611]
MYVKAAVSASHSATKGGVVLDQYDVKLIKCRVAILRLTEFLRIFKILEGTLKRRSENKVIIPLINYILALYGGPTLNISEVLRKKFTTISEFKNCKIPELTKTATPGPIHLDSYFPEVSSDRTSYKNDVYNPELQGKLLQVAIKITALALQLYERKYQLCLMERNANRPTDISGRSSALDEAAFDELVVPTEVSMALDLAVLIKDSTADTSDVSFQKLNLQVLTKFKDHMNEKALRPIKSYHTSLFRFSRATSLSQAKIIMNLPHWQYTMHRIYALLLRLFYILTITRAFLRQIYIPNKSYFAAPGTQLRSANVFELRELLQNIEGICFDDNDLDQMVKDLDRYNQSGSSLVVQPTNISQSFNSDVTVAIRKLRFYFQTLETWISVWTVIQENKPIDEKLKALDDSELQKLAEERHSNDKLEHTEMKKKEAAAKDESEKEAALKNQTGSVKTIFRRSSIGGSKLSPISSNSSSPGTLSPANMSRSPSLNNRKSAVPNRVSRTGSNLTSPLASRRGSMAETNGILANRKSTREISPSGTKIANGDDEKPHNIPGRKRSTSLQSSLVQNSGGVAGDTQRSNSLQAGAIFNQRMIRNTFAQVSGNLLGTGNSLQERPLSRLSTPINGLGKIRRSSSPSPLRKNKSPSSKQLRGKESPHADCLVLDKEKLAFVTKTSSANSDTESADKFTDSELANADQVSATESERKSSENSEESDIEARMEVLELVKKVRFTGVPPMSQDEDPRPKKRGWYKKPAILHYPPPPPQLAVQQYRLRQEGLAFQNSLRDKDTENSTMVQKRSSLLMQSEYSTNSGHKLASKLRDKLIR